MRFVERLMDKDLKVTALKQLQVLRDPFDRLAYIKHTKLVCSAALLGFLCVDVDLLKCSLNNLLFCFCNIAQRVICGVMHMLNAKYMESMYLYAVPFYVAN